MNQSTSFGMFAPFASNKATAATTNNMLKPSTSSFTAFGTGPIFGPPPQKQKPTIFASAFPNGLTTPFGSTKVDHSEPASGSKLTYVLTPQEPIASTISSIAITSDDQRNGIPKSQNFIRMWKRTPSDIVSTNKILAMLSSHFLNEDADLFTLDNLSYQLSNETKTMIAIGPLALLSFVDSSVVFDLPPLQLVFVKFLRELLKEDVVTTIDKAWKFVEDVAQFMGMTKLLEYVSLVKTCKIPISKQLTEVDDETAFALALHYLLTNPDPRDAIVASRTCSKKVSKLTTDMVMASYGLEWLMKDKLCDYVNKHQDSYKLLC